jgi:hypothetical protein
LRTNSTGYIRAYRRIMVSTNAANTSQTTSPVTYKSTRPSRCSVLERAREYNRWIDE